MLYVLHSYGPWFQTFLLDISLGFIFSNKPAWTSRSGSTSHHCPWSTERIPLTWCIMSSYFTWWRQHLAQCLVHAQLLISIFGTVFWTNPNILEWPMACYFNAHIIFHEWSLAVFEHTVILHSPLRSVCSFCCLVFHSTSFLTAKFPLYPSRLNWNIFSSLKPSLTPSEKSISSSLLMYPLEYLSFKFFWIVLQLFAYLSDSPTVSFLGWWTES